MAHNLLRRFRVNRIVRRGLIERGEYGKLGETDVAYFQNALGDAGVVLGDDEEKGSLEEYNLDWMKKWRGKSKIVLRPKSTEEVQAIVERCQHSRLALCLQGGKTGLVGGSVPVFDEIILSLKRMNQIIDFDEDSGIVRVEAGVVLETLDEFLRERGYVAPLDLGAKGTCTLGGNAATNAGGVRYLRYGSLRGSIVGLEVVTAQGQVLDCGYSTPCRKDNTGYAIGQLLIGSEGTLGIITKLALAAPAQSSAVNVALFSCSSFSSVRKILVRARVMCGEILSAVEFFDSQALNAVLKYEPDLVDPLSDDTSSSFRVLIETSGSDIEHDRAKLDAFLTHAFETELVNDGVVAPDTNKAHALWRLREGISDSMSNSGYVYKYDVSLPLNSLYKLVELTRRRLTDNGYQLNDDTNGITVAGYGHVGDSNLHLNIASHSGQDDNLLALIEPWLFNQVQAFHGSISAEHGVGICKRDYMVDVKSKPLLDTMHGLKHLFDPHGILNPYKVLPQAPF